MSVIVIVIVGWIIVYLISRKTGDERGQDKAEFMLTSGLGFRGCGIALLIIVILLVIAFFYLLSLFE